MAMLGALVGLPLAAATIGAAILSSKGDDEEYDINRYVAHEEEGEEEEDKDYEDYEDYSTDDNAGRTGHLRPDPAYAGHPPAYHLQQQHQQQQESPTFTAFTPIGSKSSLTAPIEIAQEGPHLQQPYMGTVNNGIEQYDYHMDVPQSTPDTDDRSVQVPLEIMQQEKAYLRSERRNFHTGGFRSDTNNLPFNELERQAEERHVYQSMAGGYMDGHAGMNASSTERDPTFTGYQQTARIADFLPYTNRTDLKQMPASSASYGTTSRPSAVDTQHLRSYPQFQNPNQSFRQTNNNTDINVGGQTQRTLKMQRTPADIRYQPTTATLSQSGDIAGTNGMPQKIIMSTQNSDVRFQTANPDSEWTVFNPDTADRTDVFESGTIKTYQQQRQSVQTGTTMVQDSADRANQANPNLLPHYSLGGQVSGNLSTNALQAGGMKTNDNRTTEVDRPFIIPTGGGDVYVQGEVTSNGNQQVPFEQNQAAVNDGWNVSTADKYDRYTQSTQYVSTNTLNIDVSRTPQEQADRFVQGASENAAQTQYTSAKV